MAAANTKHTNIQKKQKKNTHATINIKKREKKQKMDWIEQCFT